jgi:hypothetical protein
VPLKVTQKASSHYIYPISTDKATMSKTLSMLFLKLFLILANLFYKGLQRAKKTVDQTVALPLSRSLSCEIEI